jgi:integrase/recombinase XerD
VQKASVIAYVSASAERPTRFSGLDGVFNGADIRQSLRVNTFEDAELELEKLKQRFEKPGATDGPVTISSAWDAFDADAKSRQLKEPTLNKYKYLRADMERFAHREGLRFIVEFSLAMLGKWRSTWPNRNLSALKKLEFVRCFLRFAHDRSWIPDNPARKLKSPKITARPTLPFTPKEMVAIVAALDNYGQEGSRNRRRMKALVLLLRHSGLRIGDAVTLSRERIDRDKLFLYTSKAGTPVYCPLPSFVITALEAAAGEHERFYFWTGNGKPKSIISDWQEKLKTMFKSAELPSGHAHRFRDTFATELLLAGVPLERVSILLGHSSIRITERHYSPWVRSRQEQLERDVRSTWTNAAISDEGTSEVRAGNSRPN